MRNAVVAKGRVEYTSLSHVGRIETRRHWILTGCKKYLSNIKPNQKLFIVLTTICVPFRENFKYTLHCKQHLRSETIISGAGEDEFRKLPFPWTKEVLTPIRGQCHIRRAETILKSCVKYKYIPNIKLNMRKHSTAVKYYKKRRICIHSQSRKLHIPVLQEERRTDAILLQ